MTTIAAGNSAEVYVPLASDMTFTPGTGGVILFGCSGPDAPAPRTIYEAETISIGAGSTVFVEAINADAVYTGTVEIQTPDGAVYALSEATPYVNLTATGTAFTGACELAGFDCTAVTGTPTITIYDNTSAAGTVIVPATTLTLGRTEFAYKRALTTGCHVVLSGTQTVNILVG